VFDGGPDRLTLAAPLARAATPGQHRVSFAADDGALEMLYAPLRIAGEAQARSILADDVSVAFQYFGMREGQDAPRWGDTWRDQLSTPRLVRIELGGALRSQIVVATRIARSAACPLPAATPGCAALARRP
jgi:hypothetical protein